MSRFDQDPDFTLVWPPDLLEIELRRLVTRGHVQGIDMHWREEVETLLRQAFSSGTPLQQFRDVLDGAHQASSGYGFDEEPF